MMITPITPAKIRNIIAGGASFLKVDGEGLGSGIGETCCAAAGEPVDLFHFDSGINERPRKRKKWMSRNETNAAPIAPEM